MGRSNSRFILLNVLLHQFACRLRMKVSETFFLNAQMKITKVVEKPKGNNFGNYVLAGVFCFTSSLLQFAGEK